MSDDPFAPPPFDPGNALASLRRTLRELRLDERGGAFELRARPVVRARPDAGVLRLEIARRLSRTPEWDGFEVRDHAQLRRFVDELRKRMARWDDARDTD